MRPIVAFLILWALDLIEASGLPSFVSANAVAPADVVAAVEHVRELLIWLDVSPLRGIINNLRVDLVGEGDPFGTGPPDRLAHLDEVCAEPWLVEVVQDGDGVPGRPSLKYLSLGDQDLRELAVVVQRVGAAKAGLTLHEDPPEAGEASDGHCKEL